MAKHRKKDYQQQLELAIKEAARTLRCLPNIGLAPSQYRSCMPEIVRTLRDMDYAPEQTTIGRFGASRAAISRLDKLIVAIAGADLKPIHREIVWDRAQGKPVKVIAFEQGLSPATIKRHHSFALAEIASYLIASAQKPVSPRKMSLKRSLAA